MVNCLLLCFTEDREKTVAGDEAFVNGRNGKWEGAVVKESSIPLTICRIRNSDKIKYTLVSKNFG